MEQGEWEVGEVRRYERGARSEANKDVKREA